MKSDWGGLRRINLVVRPRKVMYHSAADGVKEGGVGRGAERTRDICGEGSVFKVRDGGSSGVDGEG